MLVNEDQITAAGARDGDDGQRIKAKKSLLWEMLGHLSMDELDQIIAGLAQGLGPDVVDAWRRQRVSALRRRIAAIQRVTRDVAD